MPTELRNRKVPSPGDPEPSPQKQEEDRSKTKSKGGAKRSEAPPDLEPNIWVVASLFIAFSVVVGTFIFYKVDNRDDGPFATWVNKKYPWIDETLNRKGPVTPLFGANAEETKSGSLKLTEEELKKYTGAEEGEPIYLAIDGVIFDVSASPAFYGPGGHYHHFVGRDATRAWITECWDEEEQFTWRMDDVEVMFTPKWLDETIEQAGKGDFENIEGLESMPQEMLATMAKKAMQRFGTVTDSEKKKRRKEDEKEAKAKVQETLTHWKNFFEGNPKYKIVGEVIRDEKPAPPKPCEEAMKKRPMKGGKLESLMSSMGGMMGGAGKGGAGQEKGEMPEFVKKKLEEEKKKAAEGKKDKAGEEEEAHDEL